MPLLGELQMKAMIDAQVFGARSDWEKHEMGGHATFIKPIGTRDVELKARIASRFDELGFIPKFFREGAREFVALEGVKSARYKDVEEAFTQQILAKL
ncbi:MAG: hypothetical protein ACKVOE_06025 [Rickettsiales bacterium]